MPGASETAIVGWLGSELKMRISSPPEKGRANREILKLLASALSIPVSRVAIVSGHAASRKSIEISGLSQAELETVFGQADDTAM